MDNCIFCKIVDGSIPSFKVLEDNDFYAFLSIGPHTPGHSLVIPKKHTDYFFDLDDLTLQKILLFSRKIEKAQRKAFNPRTGKVGVAIAGLEVPHAHLHLIPLHEMGDLDFDHAKEVTKEELLLNLDKLKDALNDE